MKKYVIIILVSLISLSLIGQSQKHYADGVTQFEAVASFGEDNNWHQLFSDYHQEIYERPVGKYRKIVVASDGSVFMTQKTNHTMYKFSPKGEKIKNIGSQGSGDGQFPMLPKVRGIIDNKHVYTTDVQGRIRVFKLNGAFYKNAKIDYMPLESVPLKNNKVAILGHVPYKNGGVKNIISILNIETGKEIIVWDKIITRRELTEKDIVVDLGNKGHISFGQIFSNPRYFQPQIATTVDGNLLIGHPRAGKVDIYNPSGSKIKSFTLEVEPLKITEADRKSYYDQALKKAKEVEKTIRKTERYNEKEKQQLIDGYYKGVEMLKDPGFYPSHLPYFAEILTDDIGNLWIVKYSKEMEPTESFQLYAYNDDGKYLGESKVQCNDYEVVLDPDQIQFYNGQVIAVVLDKSDKKIPLRLMKFNLQ